MSLPIVIQLKATAQVVGTPQHGAELRDIWETAKIAGGAFRAPPASQKDWQQCEDAGWQFAIQVRQADKAVHLQFFQPEALQRVEVGEDFEPRLVGTPQGPFQGMWACGAVLRDIAQATQAWMDALETGLIEMPAIGTQADALLHHLTDGQYTAWHLEQARRRTRQDMQAISMEAQRPLRIPRQDVQAVGPRIREKMSSAQAL